MSVIVDKKQFMDEVAKQFDEHERVVVENVLYRVFCALYFQDYNRQCDYEKMTGEQVVKAQHEVLKKLEQEFNYDFFEDIEQPEMPWE